MKGIHNKKDGLQDISIVGTINHTNFLMPSINLSMYKQRIHQIQATIKSKISKCKVLPNMKLPTFLSNMDKLIESNKINQNINHFVKEAK